MSNSSVYHECGHGGVLLHALLRGTAGNPTTFVRQAVAALRSVGATGGHDGRTPPWSRRQVRQAVEASAVKINGNVCTNASQTVEEGDIVELDLETLVMVYMQRSKQQAQSAISGMHFEDDTLMILSLPPGVGERQLTMAILPFLNCGDSPNEFRQVVSRVSKAAHGMVVVAKNYAAARALDCLSQPCIHRPSGHPPIQTTYVGVVHGAVSGDCSIRLPRRSDNSDCADVARIRTFRAISTVRVLGISRSNGAGALTRIQITAPFGPDLHFQHRALLNSIGHPVVGTVQFCKPLGRAKHSLYFATVSVDVEHPLTHEHIHVDIPEPTSYAALVDSEEKFVQQRWSNVQTRRAEFLSEGKNAKCENQSLDSLRNVADVALRAEYAIGYKEFMGYKFRIENECLIPREGSVAVVECALEILLESRQPQSGNSQGLRILDLGTGCGCLLLALLGRISKTVATCATIPKGIVYGVGVDISPAAVETARKNASELGFSDVTDFTVGTFADPFAQNNSTIFSAPYDCVICNPPYRKVGSGRLEPSRSVHEPSQALFVVGQDELVYYREVCNTIVSQRLLSHPDNKKILVFETPADLCDGVRSILITSGFKNIRVRRDCRGGIRCIAAEWV